VRCGKGDIVSTKIPECHHSPEEALEGVKEGRGGYDEFILGLK
jgi:hypothetical protein